MIKWSLHAHLPALKRLPQEMQKEIDLALGLATQTILRRAKELARGSRANVGGIPIPVQTGGFRGCITMMHQAVSDWVIFLDTAYAPYAEYVHQGTMFVSARPILFMALADRVTEANKAVVAALNRLIGRP